MYTTYTSLANALPNQVIKDLTDILTGAATSANQLSASCNQAQTSFINTVAPGWAYVETMPGEGVSWSVGSAITSTTTAIFGAGLYVIGQSTGGIQTSPDTTTWTARTSQFGATPIRDIAFNTTNLFVAVGDANKVSTSPDGITWTARTGPSGGSNLLAVTWIPFLNKFVAGDSTGKVSTSSDGVTWTATAQVTGLTAINAVWYNSNTVMVAGAGGISTSTDGSSWTAVVTPYLSPTLYALSYGNGTWCVGTSNGGIYSSTDGVNWTQSVASGTIFGTTMVFDMFFANGTFIAVSPNSAAANTIACSSNGILWDARYQPAITYLNCVCCNPSAGGYWLCGTTSGTNQIKCSSNTGGYSYAIIRAACADEPSRFKYARIYSNVNGNIAVQLMESYTNGIPTNTTTFVIQSLANLGYAQTWIMYATPRIVMLNTAYSVPVGWGEITRKFAQDNIANGYPQWGAITLNTTSCPTIYRLRHPTTQTLNGNILGALFNTLNAGNNMPTGKVKGSDLNLGLPFMPIYFVDPINQTGGEFTSLTDIWMGAYSYASAFDTCVNNGQTYSNWNPAGSTNAGSRYWVPIK